MTRQGEATVIMRLHNALQRGDLDLSDQDAYEQAEALCQLLVVKLAEARLKMGGPAIGEKPSCAVCGKVIEGEHPMTVKAEWLRSAGGVGSPPAQAIVHACDEKCAGRSPEFQR